MTTAFTSLMNEIIVNLSDEAITKYNLEAGRVQRAAELASRPTNIQPAKFDEHGTSITPSYKVLAVVGSNGQWYVVKHKFCTCEDNKRGNICKHRIAAWMRRQSIARVHAAVRGITTEEMLKELES